MKCCIYSQGSRVRYADLCGIDIGRASTNSTYVPPLTRYVYVALVVDLTALTPNATTNELRHCPY